MFAVSLKEFVCIVVTNRHVVQNALTANVSFENEDGTEVWSAGFPGLGGKPMWQLGKGTITNASAKIKELIAPNISTIIQHSAEVDAGNSGGPLLL